MEKLLSPSESVVGSLCREIEYIKLRSISINKSLNNCQSILLIKRLKKELVSLSNRKESIEKISDSLMKINTEDKLSIEFLVEISKRIRGLDE
tara:strand:+ start:735 stop:1013 length:279 start_codon:yes stop_codon:yes gene_type:complete